MKLDKLEQEAPGERSARLKRQAPSNAKALWGSVGCLALVVILLGSFGYLGYAIWGDRGDARKAQQAAEQQLQADRTAGLLSAEDRQDIEIACERSLKTKLKAPATARITKDADAIWSGASWRYSGSVDSDNNFGTSLRSTFTCTVSGATRANAAIAVDLQP